MFKTSTEAVAISAFAKERGISRLVHFTPFLNLLGIFTTRAIMPRDSVVEYAESHQEEDLLEYVTWNDSNRHDGRTNCINLSVQRINEPLFRSFKSKFREAAGRRVRHVAGLLHVPRQVSLQALRRPGAR